MQEIAEQNKEFPTHVAFIMDGNGRWATAKGYPRVEGHRRGAKAARNIVKEAHERGIRYVTFFVFSSENWSRPQAEVDDLMNMMRLYLKKDAQELKKYKARLHVIGERDRLPQDIADDIAKWEDETKDNTDIDVVMALSYGGRYDIVSAAQKLAQAAKDGTVNPDEIDEDMLSNHLMTGDIPDPDLLIRTSGEQRVSNFLLWQMAYTEMYFTMTAWPDFDGAELDKALEAYATRDRRYGKVPLQSVAKSG